MGGHSSTPDITSPLQCRRHIVSGRSVLAFTELGGLGCGVTASTTDEAHRQDCDDHQHCDQWYCGVRYRVGHIADPDLQRVLTVDPHDAAEVRCALREQEQHSDTDEKYPRYQRRGMRLQ